MLKLNDFGMPLCFLLKSLSVKKDCTFVAVSHFFFNNICEKVPFWIQNVLQISQFVFTTFAFPYCCCICAIDGGIERNFFSSKTFQSEITD